jgi:uncharacterized protein YydD (DUF2326 family)
VGKTLALELVHYCLGANTSSIFKEKLKDWIFSLDFIVNNQQYRVERNADGKKIY